MFHLLGSVAAPVSSPYLTRKLREEAKTGEFNLRAHTKTSSRNIRFIPDIMAKRAIISGISNNLPKVQIEYQIWDGTTPNNTYAIQYNPSADNTSEALIAGIAAAVIADAATHSYTVAPSDLVWVMNPPAPARSFGNPSLAVNTSRQASSTRDAFVSAAVDITASLSLTGGTTGKVELKYADDSAFTTNVVTVNPAQNGNTGTLTIGLALNQLGTATVCGFIPAGKYYRLVTTNVTGTPTYGTPALQEVLL